MLSFVEPTVYLCWFASNGAGQRVVEADPTKGLDWIEGVAIIEAVIVVVLVTAINDWNKERKFRQLKNSVDRRQTFDVVRDAQTLQLTVGEIVVGDICIVKYGNVRRHLRYIVPTGRLVDANIALVDGHSAVFIKLITCSDTSCSRSTSAL